MLPARIKVKKYLLDSSNFLLLQLFHYNTMIRKPLITFFAVLLAPALFFQACEKITPAAPADDAILDGPVEGLTAAEYGRFINGDIAFNDEVFTVETGLGPLFVASSCGSCHAGDGKGHPFTTLTRFGQSDSSGNKYLSQGGPQLQNRAIPGYVPEQIPAGATSSRFLPPANTGLGYFELVSDADIFKMADPYDFNGDGISGVPNFGILPSYITPAVNALPQGGKFVFRFGKKAGAYNLFHQTVNAYNQDMGIASAYEPQDTYTGLDVEAEVGENTIGDIVFYQQTLKAPIQRNQDDPQVQQGKSLFISIGCESCHKETLYTGSSPVAALSNKAFHPYTDLLLHDMGSGLDDGYTEGTAKTYEWRTPPLWGLGLSPDSQGGQYYLLHDGRARSIQEAIEWHGGEAAASAGRYHDLTQSEKEMLLKFLESL